jgi:hypothetical protein
VSRWRRPQRRPAVVGNPMQRDPRGKPCWVVQRRDGTYLRDRSGEVVWSAKQTGSIYTALRRYIATFDGSRHEQLRAANFPRVTRAFDCGTAGFKTDPAFERPREPLSSTDETALQLLARARRSEDARVVAHDYLLLHYRAYADAVRIAGYESRRWHMTAETGREIRRDQVVYVSPTAFIDAAHAMRESRWKGSVERVWARAFVVATPGRFATVRHRRRSIAPSDAPRKYIPLFRVPAASPYVREV